MKHAIRMGVIGAFFILDLILFLSVIIWMETGNYRSMIAVLPLLCILPFFVIFFGVASYFQVAYLRRFTEVNERAISRISPKINNRSEK
jgi:hypothetical protein